jgi:S-adenosylmethionine decarboxylase
MKRGKGIEWLVDASGCDAGSLADKRCLTELLYSVLERLSLTIVGKPRWYRFSTNSGLTGVLLLKESHLTCHTFPELGLAAFNLYVCRLRRPFPWHDELRYRLKARAVRVRRIPRSGL